MSIALRDLRRPRDRLRHSNPAPGLSPSAVSPPDDERPLWQLVAILYSGIAFLAALLIAVCFLAAYLVTGSAY